MADIRDFEPLWGEWRSVRLLGQGSYGKVYLMEKEELGTRYQSAVKHIPLPADRSDSEALYAEGLVSDDMTLHDYYRQVLDTLMTEINVNDRLKGNTNIVSYEEHRVVARAHEPGYDIFIKMELLTSLHEYTRRHAFTVADVWKMGTDLCTALTVLRREKVIHRDIKPGNIFLNSGGAYKLGDFGVARIMERTVSSMSVKGTFSYMAPEVAMGEEGDYRVDIYSLGLMLYRLMNGNRGPFLPPMPERVSHEMNNLAQRRRMQGDALPPPALADQTLSDIILRACAYLPENRWESAEQMYRALERYGASLSPEARARVVLENTGTVGGASLNATSARFSDLGGIPRASVPEAPAFPGEEPTMFQSEENADELLPGEEPTMFQPEESTDERLPGEEPTMFLANGAGNPPAASMVHKLRIPLIAGAAAVLLGAVILVATRGSQQPPPPPSPSPPPVVTPTVPPSPTVEPTTWQSPVLEEAVRQAIGVETPTPEALAGLTALSLPPSDESVTTLADLALLPGLTALDLSGHPVAQWDFPAEVGPLDSLNVAGCGCVDLSFLAAPGFQGLTSLSLANNQVVDLTPLSTLTQLESLDISGNPVSDLSPLAGLSALRALNAEALPAEDWTAVAHVVQVVGRPEPPTPEAPSAKPRTPRTRNPESPDTPPPVELPPPTVELPPTPAVIAVTSVRLSPSSALLEVGGSTSLAAQVAPANATDTSVSWSSSAPGIARVDGGGNVSALSSGTAIITATCGGHSATCAISVS